MKKLYEAWQHKEESIVTTFAEAEGIKAQFAQGLLPQDARLLHQIEAHTSEEASKLHYLKMGWGEYKRRRMS